MADLDAFFAKRDKKRNKTSSLVLTEVSGEITPCYRGDNSHGTEAHYQNGSRLDLLETRSSLGDAAEDSDTTSNATEKHLVNEGDNEWNDFEPTAPTNWDNLKIKAIRRENADDCDSVVEETSTQQPPANPWKEVDAEAEAKTVQETICDAVDAGEKDMGVLKAKVTAMNAKALLKMQTEGTMQPSQLPGAGGRKKAAAPNLKNDEAFPTLATAQNNGGRKKNKKNDSKNGDSSSKPQPCGVGALYKAPVGRSRTDGVYNPPVGNDSSRGASGGNTWSRGGGGSSARSNGPRDSNAWSRGGDNGSWSRGGSNGAASGASSWAAISSGTGGSRARGSDTATGTGASGVYVPPSMRTNNRFSALNDHL